LTEQNLRLWLSVVRHFHPSIAVHLTMLTVSESSRIRVASANAKHVHQGSTGTT
jgi:hypothetical protein